MLTALWYFNRAHEVAFTKNIYILQIGWGKIHTLRQVVKPHIYIHKNWIFKNWCRSLLIILQNDLCCKCWELSELVPTICQRLAVLSFGGNYIASCVPRCVDLWPSAHGGRRACLPSRAESYKLPHLSRSTPSTGPRVRVGLSRASPSLSPTNSPIKDFYDGKDCLGLQQDFLLPPHPVCLFGFVVFFRG